MNAVQEVPVGLADRSAILDVLRGFAIFGIFINNIYAFTGYGFYNQAAKEALPTYVPDAILNFLQTTLVEGKFYSLFSLLFGIGFSIILLRNEQKGLNALKIFYRRLVVLMLFGAAHLFLLWEGDILLLYALVGLLLPLFRKCTDKTLLFWAVALIVSPLFIDIFKVIFNFKVGSFIELAAQNIDKHTGVPTDDSFAYYLFKDGSGWPEWRNWQQSAFLYRYAYLIESNRVPKILGMFLLGFYAGRKMIYSNLEQNSSLLKKIRRWGFIIGIPSSVIYACLKTIPNELHLLDTLFYAISVVPLSLAYASAICLFWAKTKGNNKWTALAPVGRMALTNYLMQTILSIVIFYGVGLGFGGYIGPTIFFPIVCIIYLLQILYSHWWFQYYNYGPLEWIWRQMTYGKRLKLTKSSTV